MRLRSLAGAGLLGLIGYASAIPAVAATPGQDRLDRPAQVLPLAARSLLLDVARAGNRVVAVGERGHVLLSDDGGATWRQARDVPTRTMLTAVWFADAKHGWAVGHDELILGSVDGGESWTTLHHAPESQQPLLDLWFADASTGIAIGAYGSYFSTTDGGRSWIARKFEAGPLPVARPRGSPPPAPAEEDEFAPDYHLNRIAAAGDRLYIAAEAGQLYRSDDGGMSWVTLPSPYAGSFFGLLPLDGDALLAFGLRGNLFRSDDAGVSWRAVASGATAMLTDAVRVGASQLALVGLSGSVLISGDGGASWTLRQQADRKGLSAVIAGSDGTLLAVGEGGARRIALDGGVTP